MISDLDNNFFYSAFGLIWKSKGLEFPELIKKNKTTKFDIIIQENNSRNWPKLEKGIYDTDFLSFSKNDFRLTINQIGKFRIHNGKFIKWDKISPNISNQDLRTFLLSTPIGALLMQRGIVLLHGNALTKNGKAIICLGESGIGKSTLAYSLMLQGWQVLADDIVALSKNFKVLPGIPRIKLWQDSLDSFNIDSLKLTPIREKINKFVIAKDNLKISNNEYEIKKIYILKRDFDDLNLTQEVTKIESEKSKFLFLRNNTFRPRLIKGLFMEKHFAENIFKIIKAKDVHILPLPKGIKRMHHWLSKQKL